MSIFLFTKLFVVKILMCHGYGGEIELKTLHLSKLSLKGHKEKKHSSILDVGKQGVKLYYHCILDVLNMSCAFWVSYVLCNLLLNNPE